MNEKKNHLDLTRAKKGTENSIITIREKRKRNDAQNCEANFGFPQYKKYACNHLTRDFWRCSNQISSHLHAHVIEMISIISLLLVIVLLEIDFL